jgi:hypothetical protein
MTHVRPPWKITMPKTTKTEDQSFLIRAIHSDLAEPSYILIEFAGISAPLPIKCSYYQLAVNLNSKVWTLPTTLLASGPATAHKTASPTLGKDLTPEQIVTVAGILNSMDECEKRRFGWK